MRSPFSLTVCGVKELNHRHLVCFFPYSSSSSPTSAADLQFLLQKDELAVLGEGEGDGMRKGLGSIRLPLLSFICTPSNWAPPSVEAYKLSSGWGGVEGSAGGQNILSNTQTHQCMSVLLPCARALALPPCPLMCNHTSCSPGERYPPAPPQPRRGLI